MRRKRIGRGGLGEDWGLALFGELGWGGSKTEERIRKEKQEED